MSFTDLDLDLAEASNGFCVKVINWCESGWLKTQIFIEQIIIQLEANWIQNVKWECLVRQENVEFRRGGFDCL